MIENETHRAAPAPSASTADPAAGSALASARRRKLLKLGSGVVPVALTLSSRPVMATNCVTASAWGSTLGLAGTSQYARAQAKAVTLTGTYSISAWQGFTLDSSNPPKQLPNCAGWAASGLNLAAGAARRNYTVGSLVGGGGTIPTGLSSTTKVWDVLIQANPSAQQLYQRAMLVAWLNLRVSTGSPRSTVAQCTQDTLRSSYNSLNGLGAAPGIGPDGKPWTQAGVVTYLYENWLAR